jgi:hypothetical protein
VGVVGVAFTKPAIDLDDLALEVAINTTEAVTLPRHGSGTSSRSSNFRRSTPNRSVTGHGRPTLIRVEWIRCLSIDLVLDQVKAKAGQLAFLANMAIGKPDRRHQIALG